jgi:O-antigen ligase
VPASPIFGHGPGTYGGGAAAVLGNSKVYDELGLPFGVAGTSGFIDNNWFSLWGEIGTLGLALYVWMFVILFRSARAVYRESRDPFIRGMALGYLGATLAFALQAMLGTYLEVRTISLYFWMFGAFIVVAGQQEKLS